MQLHYSGTTFPANLIESCRKQKLDITFQFYNGEIRNGVRTAHYRFFMAEAISHHTYDINHKYIPLLHK